MTDLNTLTIHGRIVRNAEFTTTDAGLAIARFALALNKARRNQNNEWINETTFVPMALFGKRAVALGPYMRKGRGITVQGHLKQNRWEKDGEKRSELAVIVDNVLFDAVPKKPEEVQNAPQAGQNLATQAMQASAAPVQKPEVPFEEPPFMSEEEFYLEAEFDFPPPEVMESFEIF